MKRLASKNLKLRFGYSIMIFTALKGIERNAFQFIYFYIYIFALMSGGVLSSKPLWPEKDSSGLSLWNVAVVLRLLQHELSCHNSFQHSGKLSFLHSLKGPQRRAHEEISQVAGGFHQSWHTLLLQVL